MFYTNLPLINELLYHNRFHKQETVIFKNFSSSVVLVNTQTFDTLMN